VNAALITGLNNPRGIALSGDGMSLFVANLGNGTVGHYDAVTGAPINAALLTGLNDPFRLIVGAAAAIPIPGDFDDDGDVDPTDYLTLVANLHTDVGSLTTEQSYLLGDMTRDLELNGRDFLAFVKAYDDANGVAAFQAMLAAIPEPSTGALAAVACWALGLRRPLRRGLSRSTVSRRPRGVATPTTAAIHTLLGRFWRVFGPVAHPVGSPETRQALRGHLS
jgi:hypothetical protein